MTYASQCVSKTINTTTTIEQKHRIPQKVRIRY